MPGAEAEPHSTEPSFSESRAARLCSRLVLAVALAASAWAFLHIRLHAGSFELIFKDMGVTLPAVSAVVTSRAYPWALVVLAAAGVVKEALVRNQTITLVCNGLHLFLAIMIYFVYLFGIIEPIFVLMEAVNT